MLLLTFVRIFSIHFCFLHHAMLNYAIMKCVMTIIKITSREFNHKIKGIGHSSFTPDEVSMLKLTTSGNESVNARYLAKYDANAITSTTSATSGRYHDHSNRHNNNINHTTRNVIMASSTMKPPQNNSDLQHLRSWIQQKYIVKCWYVGGGEDEIGAKKAGGPVGAGMTSGGEAGRIKIMPTKVHRPTSSSSSLPKPINKTSTSGTSHSTNASHDDSFFDAIASSSAAAHNKVNDASSSWDAFGGSLSPAAFQADFGEFPEQQQQEHQQQQPSQFQAATMVSLPPLTAATGGSSAASPIFQATFNQDVTAVIPQNNMMMPGVQGGGSFVANFSSMSEPQQPEMQQQPHPTMQVQSIKGFASFQPVQPLQMQLQQQHVQFLPQGVQPDQNMHPPSNYGYTQGGSDMMMNQQQPPQGQQQQEGGVGWGEMVNMSEFPHHQQQEISTPSGWHISNVDASAAPMPSTNPNAFNVIDSEKISAFDAFEGLALEPTLTTTSYGNVSTAEVSNISATVQMTGANETYKGEQITSSDNVERSMFATDPNVLTESESNRTYHTMSMNGAVENSINNGNDDIRETAKLRQETTLFLQKLNLQQLMQVHQLVSSMTLSTLIVNENQRTASTVTRSSYPLSPHNMSNEYLSSNGMSKMGVEDMGENSIESMDAAKVPSSSAPTPSQPPVMTAPLNTRPPVEKEGNPFDF